MHRKTTRELLADSFRELAETKAIDKITTKEIARNAGYSQATFYRQFKDKYDLIAWDYAQGIEKTIERIGVDGYSWRQALLDGAFSYQEQREYLSNLLIHTSGYDSFVRYMTEINYNALKVHILKTSGKDELDEKTDMYVRIYVHGTVHLISDWVLGLFDVSPETLAEVHEGSIPAPLRPYLLNETI